MKGHAGSWPVEINVDLPAGGYGAEFRPTGIRFPDNVSREAQLEIRAIADEANRPARRVDVAEALNVVSKVLPHQGDAESSGIWTEAVWMAVSDWPADVINESLRDLLKSEEWRPVPAKVSARCYEVGASRRAMLNLTCRGRLKVV